MCLLRAAQPNETKHMKLHRPETRNPLQPTSQEIYDLVDAHNNWIPTTSFIRIPERMNGDEFNLLPEEVLFIHPKDLCILRIKHEMAVAMISGNPTPGDKKPGDRIIKLCPEAVEKIDDEMAEHGGVVNPNGGGFTQKIREAYGKDPNFNKIAYFHRDALVALQKKEAEGPFHMVVVSGLPYYTKNKDWFSKKELRDELAQAGDFPREEIALIKLSSPRWVDGIHGGKSHVFLRSQDAAKALLALHGKLQIESKDGKMFDISITVPAAPKVKSESKPFQHAEDW